jgi:hypothetical protein
LPKGRGQEHGILSCEDFDDLIWEEEVPSVEENTKWMAVVKVQDQIEGKRRNWGLKGGGNSRSTLKTPNPRNKTTQNSTKSQIHPKAI